MKLIRKAMIVLVLAVVAVLGIVFWPKIREWFDRWMAASGENEVRTADTQTAGSEADPA